MRVISAVLLFLGLSLVCAQNSTQYSCSCYCCSSGDDGAVCGVVGAYAVSGCDQCSDNLVVGPKCQAAFPEKCALYAGEQDCGSTDPDGDWAGDWVLDPCSACLLDEQGAPLGDCKPCCGASADAGCDCIYGTITISDITPTDDAPLQLSVSATAGSGAATEVGNETGSLGTTATVAFALDTYDIIKHGDHIQVLSRKSQLSCSVYATRNPPQTSMLKLALLLGGVGAAVLLCVVFCCCNPCKKKKKEEQLLGEGQEGQTSGEGVTNQVTAVGGVNYTGEKVNPSDL